MLTVSTTVWNICKMIFSTYVLCSQLSDGPSYISKQYLNNAIKDNYSPLQVDAPNISHFKNTLYIYIKREHMWEKQASDSHPGVSLHVAAPK